MKKCPSCGELVQGRTDKKFCSPYCKSAYHYQQNRDRPNNLFKQIDDQLKQNRRILKEYNKAGKATVRKEVLEKAGFPPGISPTTGRPRTETCICSATNTAL